MKRVLFLVAILTLCFSSSRAEGVVNYQGEIECGYSLGMGGNATGRVNLHTIQGISIGKYLSTGVGAGLDYHYNFDETSELIVPVFLNVKGYLALGKKVTPFISCDAGVGFGMTGSVVDNMGLYVTPAVGFTAGIFKLQAGYNLQSLNIVNISNTAINSVQVKIGIMF